jgi:hypothetical protein
MEEEFDELEQCVDTAFDIIDQVSDHREITAYCVH